MNWIIAFTGLPQTGKTTLARRLADHLQCKFVSFGDFVRNEAKKVGIANPIRKDLQDIGQRLVETDVVTFCRDVLQTVSFSPDEQIVIDGVRHVEALRAISSLSQRQPIKLIHLFASLDIRKARGAPDAVDSELTAIDAHEVESQTERELRDLADLVVDASANADESFARIVRWIRHECSRDLPPSTPAY